MNEASSEIVSEEERRIRKLEAEVDILYRAGIVEIAVRNPSVAEYIRHWEDRAIKAERERDRWQPIETAPSATEAPEMRVLVYNAQWSIPVELRPVDGEWWRNPLVKGGFAGAPTHWKPLPSPPGASE